MKFSLILKMELKDAKQIHIFLDFILFKRIFLVIGGLGNHCQIKMDWGI